MPQVRVGSLDANLGLSGATNSFSGSRQPDVDVVGFHFRRVGAQINANRPALGLTRRNMESPLVPGAFDDFSQHQPIRENFFFMSTEPVGRVEAGRSVIDGILFAGMFKRRDVLLIDFVHVADSNPGKPAIRHSAHLQEPYSYSPRPARRRADVIAEAPSTRSSLRLSTGGSARGQFRETHPGGRHRCGADTLPRVRGVWGERGMAPSGTCDVRCGNSC